MPKKFIFKINNEPHFEGKLYTGRCMATTKAGTRCKRHCIIGYEYCYTHLETEKDLKIKDSTIPQADKGLFAYNRKSGNNDILFEPNDSIIKYNGEKINRDTLNDRYLQYNAPYAIDISSGQYIDSALKRGIGSLANTNPSHNNARFAIDRINKTTSLKATKNIRNNQEIFVSYGRAYRLHEPNTSFTTKNTR